MGKCPPGVICFENFTFTFVIIAVSILVYIIYARQTSVNIQLKETQIPKNNRISPLTVVILSKPKNFVVPEGHFKTIENPQLVLPEIYTVGNIDKEKILLQNIGIKRYFEIIKTEEKKVDETTIQKLIKNI